MNAALVGELSVVIAIRMQWHVRIRDIMSKLGAALHDLAKIFFLERIGADLTAKYVAFRCADDYTESIDMATALHPQTILATKYAREPITDPFGFPLRLRTSTKLGFKNPKWVISMEVTNEFRETYYSKQGFNWFSGI